ncbi:MAG: hypothetical protein KKA19_05155 [Candidatus Margulisbacteria bacterium]|nr:hypothetical protein [Candidatus Margulisiibacteriota bacterium]
MIKKIIAQNNILKEISINTLQKGYYISCGNRKEFTGWILEIKSSNQGALLSLLLENPLKFGHEIQKTLTFSIGSLEEESNITWDPTKSKSPKIIDDLRKELIDETTGLIKKHISIKNKNYPELNSIYVHIDEKLAKTLEEYDVNITCTKSTHVRSFFKALIQQDSFVSYENKRYSKKVLLEKIMDKIKCFREDFELQPQLLIQLDKKKKIILVELNCILPENILHLSVKPLKFYLS